MNRLLTFLIAWALAAPVFAQGWVSDSVDTGPSYVNDVYYSMSNGTVTTARRAEWHLAFGTSAGSSVLVNTPSLVDCYLVANDTTTFATLDTTGLLTDAKKLFNSQESWVGALNTFAGGGNDIGWGLYDFDGSIGGIPHVIWGHATFVLQFRDLNNELKYRKFFIRNRRSGVYTLVYANLDGTNAGEASIAVADFQNRNFGYLAFTETGIQTLNREPARANWDYVFTRQTDPLYNGVQRQELASVVSNAGVRQAKYESLPNADTYTIADTSTAQWNPAINTVGADWKQFAGMGWNIETDWYWIVDANDDTFWLLNFENRFGGSATGKYYFRKRKIIIDSGVNRANALAVQSLTAYPNPTQGLLNIAFGVTTPQPNLALQVTDAMGRVVHQQTLSGTAGLHQHTLDLQQLSSGLYYLQVGGVRERILVK